MVDEFLKQQGINMELSDREKEQVTNTINFERFVLKVKLVELGRAIVRSLSWRRS